MLQVAVLQLQCERGALVYLWHIYPLVAHYVTALLGCQPKRFAVRHRLTWAACALSRRSSTSSSGAARLSRSFRSKWDRERMRESAPSLGESKSEGRQSSKQTQNQKRPSNRSVVKQKARCRRHISTYICLYVCSSLIIVFLLLSFCFHFFLALHDLSFVGALHHVRRYCCCLVIGKWEAVGDQVQVQYVEERWQT